MSIGADLYISRDTNKHQNILALEINTKTRQKNARKIEKMLAILSDIVYILNNKLIIFAGWLKNIAMYRAKVLAQ